MERRLHAWALIIRVEESDHHSAAQSLDCNQVFGREFLAVFGEEMGFDVTRTSPLETAEQAVSRSLVYVLPVPCELLATPKAYFAIDTDSPHLAVRVTTAAVLPVGAMPAGSHIPSSSKSCSVGSLGTSLEYISSDYEKPWRCLVVPRRSITGVAAPLETERDGQLIGFGGFVPLSARGNRVALGRCKDPQYVTPAHYSKA